MRRLVALLALAGLAGVSSWPTAGGAPAPEKLGWGTVRGRFVWAGDKAPEPEKVKLGADADEFRRAGATLSERLVVHKENKGVGWVMVWLADPDDPKKALPAHDDLKDLPPPATVDLGNCRFDPHVLGVREKQPVYFRNDGRIPFNVKVNGNGKNPDVNVILPVGKKHEVSGWVADRLPCIVDDAIHPTMRMYVRVFNHPYFAVTDKAGKFEMKNVPAGEWKLMAWHEERGYLPDKNGTGVAVRHARETDTGEFAFPPK